jgi:signal transduction histidine kinase/FixJ family two-component response regulator
VASNKRGLIKSSQLFWDLSNAQINKLIPMCEEQSFDAGLRIFAEGEKINSFYIIKQGKVALEMEVRIGSRTRRQAVIDVLEQNEVFGYPALSDVPVNSNSAIAIENSVLLVFNGDLVRELCDEDLELGYKVSQEITKLVSDRLSKAKRTLAHVLSVTSHDLRAPLATVQSSIDAVAGGYVGEINSRQEELLAGGKQRISDLIHMIDNILDISYVEIRGADFEKVDLADVIATSINDVIGIAQNKGVVIENNDSNTSAFVLGIPKRLRQVLTNLLGNGVKFTPSGGLVTINSRDTDDKIHIEVADTGVGIAPEDLPKIFADFYRGMRLDAEGAGLGLAIAKRIVEAHGGRIWAESPDPESGKGSKFSISLPKVFEPTTTLEEEEQSTIAGAKVLIADDDPEMQKITAAVLESQGYQVRTADDGEDALVKIEEEEPDLLVLDLLMPRMDGFDVCKRLKARREHGGTRIPVLILSAVREESSRRRYELETEMDLDVDDYITKPISPPILLQRAERALRRSKAVAATSLTIIKNRKEVGSG